MVRDEPLSATSGFRARQAPLDFNLVGLHWKGPGSVSFRTLSRAGRWSCLAGGGGRGRGLAGRRARPKARARRGWKLGSPYWTGRRRRSSTGSTAASRSSARTSSGATPKRSRPYFPPRRRPRGPADDRPPRRMGRGRVDRAREALLRRRGSLCGRPPHRRDELLLGFGIAGDRPGHRALPRARERLERHRLQLPRRQVRPGLRGPRRRDHEERRRRSRRGVQHRKHRRRGDRQLRVAGHLSRSARRPREAARVASRRRAREPTRQAHVDVRREPALPRRDEGQAARGLGAP